MINLVKSTTKIFARGANKDGYVSYAMPLYREDLAVLGIKPDQARGKVLTVKRRAGKLVVELAGDDHVS